MSIETRYRRLREEIEACCVSAGRDPGSVRLVAVSKTVGIPEVAQALAAGAMDFGENRPDQIVPKHAAYPQANWHFIGNIQSRRIADIVPCAEYIHSVFAERHLAKIDAAAAGAGKVQKILLEVNVSGEESKSGLAPSEVPAMLDAADRFDHLAVCGLMTMAPQGDREAADACFAGLAALRDELDGRESPRHGEVRLSELSMGMSEDWHQAIPHGATMIRIGRAVFSDEFEPAAQG